MGGFVDWMKGMFTPPGDARPPARRHEDGPRQAERRDDIRHHDRDVYEDQARHGYGSPEQRRHPDAPPPGWGGHGSDHRGGW